MARAKWCKRPICESTKLVNPGRNELSIGNIVHVKAAFPCFFLLCSIVFIRVFNCFLLNVLLKTKSVRFPLLQKTKGPDRS